MSNFIIACPSSVWVHRSGLAGSIFASCDAPCGNNNKEARCTKNGKKHSVALAFVAFQLAMANIDSFPFSFHSASLPKLAKSAWLLGSCQPSSTVGSAKWVSNDAQCLQNILQHISRAYSAVPLQQSPTSLLLPPVRTLNVSHCRLPAQFALIFT